MNPTLNQLINFVPQNETEFIITTETVLQEYLSNTKSNWSGGKYYLGGQIKLDPDDVITDELMKKVNDIYSKPSEIYYCNSAEMASLRKSITDISELTQILKKYKQVQKNRILKELNKTKMNTDVNEMIVEML
jgi:hypothetical protein